MVGGAGLNGKLNIGRLLWLARPAKAGQQPGGHGGAHQRLVGAVEQPLKLRPLEQLELLQQLFPGRGKAGIVGGAEVGEDAFGGLDDGSQPAHLPHFRNAGLENAQGVALGVQLPHAEGHAHLRIIGARRAADVLVGAQELSQPLLHDGFAVGAGNPDNRAGERGAVGGGQGLQGRQWAFNLDKTGLGVGGEGAGQVGVFGYDEQAHTLGIKGRQVAVAVVAGAAQGEEQRPGGQARPPAIEHEVANEGSRVGGSLQQAAGQQGRKSGETRERHKGLKVRQKKVTAPGKQPLLDKPARKIQLNQKSRSDCSERLLKKSIC